MADETVSPLTISFMLACYYSAHPENQLEVSWDSDAGRCIRQWLKDNGLIDDENKATSRGKAWVEYICQTPLPVQEWKLPRRMFSDGR